MLKVWGPKVDPILTWYGVGCGGGGGGGGGRSRGGLGLGLGIGWYLYLYFGLLTGKGIDCLRCPDIIKYQEK